MSVYKRKGDDTYSYDFQIQGRRFSGDTKSKTKRDAKAVEDRRKDEARAQLSQEAQFFSSDMDFEIASSRWWIEVGQFNSADSHATLLRDLAWLSKHIGPKTKLVDITDNFVAGLVARRRGEYRFGQKKFGLVSNSTVNRSCTERLREIILRARKVWKVTTADVDFGSHMLEEPQERVREASTVEESAILEQLSTGYDAAVEFAFLSGCRRMEILGLEWTSVDFFSKRFTVLGKGKKTRTIPMSDAIYELLWAEKNNHPKKVFTFVAQRTLKKQRLIKGKRYPLTEAGLKTAFRRAVPNSGVANFRFHDTRHTAATRVLRSSNLRVAQKLLGHSDIATTTKYAHAMDDDIRDALNRVSGTNRPTENPTKVQKEEGK